MNRKAGIMVLTILLGIGLWIPHLLSAQTKKIRVVVGNSSIRLKPDVQSEIIGSPSLGVVFEVIERGDVWYKVKLKPEKYGREYGYLNKIFVEEMPEIEKPAIKAKQKPEVKDTEAAIEKKDEEAEKQKEVVSESEKEKDRIRSVVNEYIEALHRNRLILFYEQNTTAEYFSKVREDAEWMSRTYDRIHSCVSDISIQLINTREAKVNISLIITGLPGTSGSRKLLFEGKYNWDLTKQNNRWKIAKAASQPYR